MVFDPTYSWNKYSIIMKLNRPRKHKIKEHYHVILTYDNSRKDTRTGRTIIKKAIMKEASYITAKVQRIWPHK